MVSGPLFYHNIILSYYHQITTPNGWSHFRCQVKFFDTFWVIYPFSKEVSPKIRAVGAITFHDASANADQKFIAPPKRHVFEKSFSEKVLQFFFPKICFGVEKWKVANRPKRVFLKFRADPSFVRGVNGRSKFQKKMPTSGASRMLNHLFASTSVA